MSRRWHQRWHEQWLVELNSGLRPKLSRLVSVFHLGERLIQQVKWRNEWQQTSHRTCMHWGLYSYHAMLARLTWELILDTMTSQQTPECLTGRLDLLHCEQQHSDSANLRQRQHFNQKSSVIPIRIARLIYVGSIQKWCGCITLSASVILLSMVQIGCWLIVWEMLTNAQLETNMQHHCGVWHHHCGVWQYRQAPWAIFTKIGEGECVPGP